MADNEATSDEKFGQKINNKKNATVFHLKRMNRIVASS